MDDFLDLEDESVVLAYLSRGVLPYSLLILLIALSVHPSLSAALFLAAYLVGMFSQSSGEQLPTHLSPYGEGLIALAIGIWLSGWELMGAAVVIIASVQALDDLVDYEKDRMLGIPSWATRLGLVQTSLVLLITAGIGLLVAPRVWLEVTVISRLISALFDYGSKYSRGGMEG